MSHRISATDRGFLDEFEAHRIPPGDFDHRAHVRLAYVYLADLDPDGAHARMRDRLLGFLAFLGADPSKYHETITRAWILAVRHFMDRTPDCASADDFIERNPKLLDSGIMLQHYSAEVLFSDAARASYVDPDIVPIPPADPRDQGS